MRPIGVRVTRKGFRQANRLGGSRRRIDRKNNKARKAWGAEVENIQAQRQDEVDLFESYLKKRNS